MVSRGGGFELGSEPLGQRPAGLSEDGVAVFQPGERGAEVLAVRFRRDRQPVVGPGLEDVAQLLCHPGHLRGVAHRLVAQEQILVSRLELIDRGLLSPQFRRAVGPTVAERQLRQPVECGAVGRVGREEPLQGQAFRGVIPAARGEPGRQPVDLGRGRLRGRQVLERLPSLGDTTGRQRPVQPGPPDGDILVAALPAGVEPPRRLVERPLTDRQVGPPQPDPIVLGSQLRRALQEGADRLGGGIPQTQRDAESDHFDGRFGAALARPIQALPVRLDQPARLIEPTFMPVERGTEPAQVRARRSQDRATLE